MGKPIAKAAPVAASSESGSASGYRDDPDAVSMHTTRSDYEYDDGPALSDNDDHALPSYTDSEANEAVRREDRERAARVNHVRDSYAVIPATWYRVSVLGRRVNQGEVSIRLDERLDDVEELLKYIQDVLLPLPPRQCVQISGWHWQTSRDKDGKRSKQRVDDFDITLSLQPYLGTGPTDLVNAPTKPNDFYRPSVVDNSAFTYRGSIMKSRAKGYRQDIQIAGGSGGDEEANANPSLEDWIREYCSSKSSTRIFRVTRSVSGIDRRSLRDSIVAAVRQTNYRGHVEVNFPIHDRAVDVYSTSRLNQWRTTSWVRWLFYLTFLWLFAWPVLALVTKRWAVVNVDWPYSIMHTDEGYAERDPAARRRRFAIISESDWLQRHRRLIQKLARQGHMGDAYWGMAGFEDDEPVDRANDGAASPAPRTEDNLPPGTGNARADSTISAIAGGINLFRRGLGHDVEGWGADS